MLFRLCKVYAAAVGPQGIQTTRQFHGLRSNGLKKSHFGFITTLGFDKPQLSYYLKGLIIAQFSSDAARATARFRV